MPEFTKYTTIYAPVLFFISGIFIVMFLNKFIGKKSAVKNKEESRK
ncbi:MAG: hypothetical protein HGA62_09865 [Chlorobiaceae bacterium]|nr:hypothetical protein [Chlorobiaceae bacterium]NTV61308.1 hypothetical protein [Chlorobiaceae bacterium]